MSIVEITTTGNTEPVAKFQALTTDFLAKYGPEAQLFLVTLRRYPETEDLTKAIYGLHLVVVTEGAVDTLDRPRPFTHRTLDLYTPAQKDQAEAMAIVAWAQVGPIVTERFKEVKKANEELAEYIYSNIIPLEWKADSDRELSRKLWVRTAGSF